MPLYSYTCEECNKPKFVMKSSISDRDNQTCPDCKSKLKRGIDSPGGVWAPTSTGGGLKV